MAVYIALLRGINVGGHHKIKMAELRDLFADLGFPDARTVLQSGNVVFESGANADAVRQVIESGIAARLGLDVQVILRTREQWREIIAAHPFTDKQLAEANKLLIAFLSDPPAPEGIEKLLEYEGPELFEIIGQQVYIYYAEGMGRSKLDNAAIERRLKVSSSGRNWNTVQKLAITAGEV